MESPEKFNSSKEVIAFLAQTFPNCFTTEGEARPLKIGIFQELASRLEEEPRVSKTLLRSTLRHYTNSWRYLYSIKEGAHRVDLDGNEGDVIEKEHADHAKNQLEESKAKAAELRKENKQNSPSVKSANNFLVQKVKNRQIQAMLRERAELNRKIKDQIRHHLKSLQTVILSKVLTLR